MGIGGLEFGSGVTRFPGLVISVSVFFHLCLHFQVNLEWESGYAECSSRDNTGVANVFR